MSKQIYEVIQGTSIIARRLEKDEYFQTKLGHAGDYVTTIAGNDYLIPAVVFDAIFQTHYSCLQDFIDRNKDKYSDDVLNILANVFERDN